MSCPITQFRWHIKNFGSVNSKAPALFSGDFTPAGTKVRLCLLYSHWHGHGNFSLTKVFFKQVSSLNPRMRFRFWAENTDGEILVPAIDDDDSFLHLNQYCTFGPEKMFNPQDPKLQEKLIDDTIVIVCETEPSYLNFEGTVLIENHALVEGTIIYFGNKHPLHYVETNLLKARFGDQFRKLFDTNDHAMKLGNDSLKKGIFTMFKKFIHEGKLTRNDLCSKADVLYNIACECGLNKLKRICFNYMVNTLNDSNVFIYLGAALIHNDEHLVLAVLDYLRRKHQGKRLSQLVHMEEWQAMKKEFPEVHQQMEFSLLSIFKMS